MREYDLIAIGTGSGMSIVDAVLSGNPSARAAVIDDGPPGGICLTRGCIPSKLLLYPAEVVRTIQGAEQFGIEANVKRIRFEKVMDRMRHLIGTDIAQIRQVLTTSPQIDYYPTSAAFVAPYTLRVGKETIHAPRILLGLGSRPTIPPVEGLPEVGYLTSDTVLDLKERPDRLVILGGGYIACEYGYFFAAMGSAVTILGRNPRLLPGEDPEISEVLREELSRSMKILTNHEVVRVKPVGRRGKSVACRDRATGATVAVDADELLVATGRSPTSDLVNAKTGGITLDTQGWVVVDEFLETSQKDVWALGDATGKFPFKHKANYDAKIVYYNAILGRPTRADYHAVPHAVFTDPEVASVGLTEPEALTQLGGEQLLVGRQRFADTAKGEAMGLSETKFFVKVLAETDTRRLVGAHIVGPRASDLIQELVTLMYTPARTVDPITDGMHIHPALSEVVERAVLSLRPYGASHHHHAT
ncbi:MAG: dihydrolipoyl dehydrogenase [Thermoplasmata archaeon]|nr:dihydrolipoyl dehydrogenase [Thermoplasmata archaeon]